MFDECDIEDIVSYSPLNVTTIANESQPENISNTKFSSDFSSNNLFAKAIVEWYRKSRRLLPWRGDLEWFKDKKLDPIPVSAYGIWICEVMCQQTRIDTVITYWLKWMETFPDVFALARANYDEVNTCWSGLGYYRRAKFLHLGARMIVDEYNGKIPATYKELIRVPGIGPYTAGAILSIAYDVRVNAVDGNVMRVMARMLELQESGAKLERVCNAVLDEILDPSTCAYIKPLSKHNLQSESKWGSVSEFNQALMELGALVCTPSSPSCRDCPVRQHCAARQSYVCLETPDTSVITKYPVKLVKTPKQAVKPIHTLLYAAVISASSKSKEHKYLFTKRPQSGLLAGQWELPNLSLDVNSDANALSNPEPDSKSTDSVRGTFCTLPSVPPKKKRKSSKLPAAEFGSAICESKTSSNAVDDPTSSTLRQPDPEQIANLHHLLLENTNVQISNEVGVAGNGVLLPVPIKHVFSHQTHVMYIYLIETNCSDVELKIERKSEWCWMSEQDLLLSVGLTTGMKKIIHACDAYLSEKN